MNQCGLETKLSALGIGKDGMIEMAKSVNAERLANNPVKLTSDDIHSTVSALGNLLG
jgi:alcohol dehydrogenase class IV